VLAAAATVCYYIMLLLGCYADELLGCWARLLLGSAPAAQCCCAAACCCCILVQCCAVLGSARAGLTHTPAPLPPAQIGLLQAMAGFFVYLIVINDLGYRPHTLLGMGRAWNNAPMMCLVNPDGSVHDCGFGCGGLPSSGPLMLPNASSTAITQLLGARTTSSGSSINTMSMDSACRNGCPEPGPNDILDPFISMTQGGFRGFAAGAEAVCGRSCEWHASLSATKRQEYLAASKDPNSPLRLILTEADDALFKQYCAQPGSEALGFKGRGQADGNHALPGAHYYWESKVQQVANLDSQRWALAMAQSSYFIAVVVCKVATALCAKTRVLSLFQHGIRSNTWLLWALLFMVSLSLLLVYVPFLNIVFGTAGPRFWYLTLGIPWALLIFCYDEGRKALLRRYGPGSRFWKAMYW
jgi:hypothetical protein